MIKIQHAEKKFIPSYYECLGEIAKEKVYLEMLTPPPFEKVIEFQSKLIDQNGVAIYATENEKVVGWCDVFPFENPRMKHRGSLGMGLLKDYRGLGFGSQLLQAAIEHAPRAGFEKIELQVYTSNHAAIKLYKKFGFIEEGLIKHYRKLEDQYFDALSMAIFL